MGKGNSPNSRIGWDKGFSLPGEFKLDHLQPIQPILFWYFSNFYTFILGNQFLLPQRANNGKSEFFQLKNWMRQRVLSAWGINPGPFWASWAKIWAKIFDHLDLYTGAPFSYYPRENRKGRKGMQKSKDANSTQCSQAVSHPSTNRAQHCLTSVIGRELVYSMWYGRCREKRVKWVKVEGQAALFCSEVRFCQLLIGVMQRGVSAWGVQIGSFAAGWAPFVLKFFKLFHFHTGRPILITPEGQ